MADTMSRAIWAVNTLKASWWKLLCARWFGDRITGFDDIGDTRTVVVGYRWRGVVYLMTTKQMPRRNR